MQSELLIGPDPIPPPDPAAAHTWQSTCGAVITFLGVVRDDEAGQPIAALDYEAFVPMAEHQFARLFAELERRWPTVRSLRLVHRIGRVPVGEPSLRIDLAAPHRPDAFAACQWLIDEMKRVVPIWKRPVPRNAT
ncbi:MAG: molybdenum cofactor biosynthesis protein MoaE [Verrucomicrobiae bacterium]|nr:molybdenum cofactor biosynthesis protein MoaE [Verrucomicrobiae bacterium]